MRAAVEQRQSLGSLASALSSVVTRWRSEHHRTGQKNRGSVRVSLRRYRRMAAGDFSGEKVDRWSIGLGLSMSWGYDSAIFLIVKLSFL
jgi:hypothetical protein